MLTHRFLPEDFRSTVEQQNLEFHSCKTDDSDDQGEITKQKQTTMKFDDENISSKPVTKMRQCSKH